METYKVIVAYDFQDLSNAALKQAHNLAQFVDSGILLVSVINDDLLTTSGDSSSDSMSKNAELMQKEISGRLQEIADKSTAESGVKVDYRIETGKIYERVLEIAKENKARFVIMGRTSKESGRGGFGSNTMRVVEKSPCPVISIPSVECGDIFKNIVLPIDLTKQTREEVFNAISFGLFFDATIHLVSVVMGGISERKSRIFKKMQGMRKMIEENGVNCTEKLFKKSHKAVHEQILDYSNELKADALMIMTHQEISTSDTYIGAVANQIIKESHVPVISLTSAAAIYKQSEKSSYWFGKLFTTKN